LSAPFGPEKTLWATVIVPWFRGRFGSRAALASVTLGSRWCLAASGVMFG